MAETGPVQYAARDGLQIRGYLTLPLGRPAKGLPLIVMPHGGPWVRDSWGFDAEAQFLANRGYAVLQPNYRGSAGYGLNFLKAGFRQYGLKIQDDITDGVNWAVAQGIADPKRVCIFGASFGGYAALVGATETPELYRCVIDRAGPADLPRQLRSTAEHVPKLAQSFARIRIGDCRAEKDQLKEASPISHVEDIRAPIMLIYGGRDPVVDVEQSRRLEKALRHGGKNVEVVFEPDEGHSDWSETNTIKLYQRVDAFLKAHLK